MRQWKRRYGENGNIIQQGPLLLHLTEILTLWKKKKKKDENASITAYKVHHRRPTQDPILLCFAAVVQLGNRTVRLGR